MCSEFLTRLFNNDEANGKLHGIDRGAPLIIHLMYVDDLIVMCRAIENEAKAVKKCMDKYYILSSQKVNEEKFNIPFSKNIARSVKRQIKQVLGTKEMRPQSIYLRNSLSLGKNKREKFGKVKENVMNRVQGWNTHMLSKTGKTTLIKTVVQSIPCYTMTTFLISKSICNEMDLIIQKFWWQVNSMSSGYFAFKNWKDICKPKDTLSLGPMPKGKMLERKIHF